MGVQTHTHIHVQRGGVSNLAVITSIAKQKTQWGGLHSCLRKPEATNQLSAVTPAKVAELTTSQHLWRLQCSLLCRYLLQQHHGAGDCVGCVTDRAPQLCTPLLRFTVCLCATFTLQGNGWQDSQPEPMEWEDPGAVPAPFSKIKANGTVNASCSR